MRDIGKNIRQLRTGKNMTQDELAEKLFVTRQTVSNYETGKSRPDVDTLVKISEILDTDIHQVIYGPEPVKLTRDVRRLLIGGMRGSEPMIAALQSVSASAALQAVKRAVTFLEERTALTAQPEEGALEYIAGACGGDLRKAMNAVEVLFSAGLPENGILPLTLADAKAVTQKSAMRADRDGDNHYDLLSALQKSIRGSDPDAACHYLARLLEAGQMQSACRRLMVIAAEDVGLAYPMIIPIVKACVDMALMTGMPEARIPLGDAAVLMATSPKSNSGHIALDMALADVRKGKSGDFPRHLQNVHADSYTMEREQGYLYPHDYPGHWVKQQYLPDELVGTKYYEYGPNKVEQAAKQYWQAIKGE